MHIDKDILLARGGKQKKYLKDEVVFTEGDSAKYYYQVVKGTIRIYNINDSAGKEFTHGLFEPGSSFGEPSLIIDEVYPTTAVANHDSSIILVPKENFIQILLEYPEINMKFTHQLARNVNDKAITFKELMSNTPQTRILGFLRAFKKKSESLTEKVLVTYTRQEIANFTGLRVETVIRALNKMNKKNLVEIIKRKLYF